MKKTSGLFKKKIFKAFFHLKKHRCCYIGGVFMSFAIFQLFILFGSILGFNTTFANLSNGINMSNMVNVFDIGISGNPKKGSSIFGEYRNELNKDRNDISNFFEDIIVDFSIDGNDKKYIVVQKKEDQSVMQLRDGLGSTTQYQPEFFVQTLENGEWETLGDEFTGNIETIYFDSDNTPYIINYDFHPTMMGSMEDGDLNFMRSVEDHNFTIKKRYNNNWVEIGTFEGIIAELYFDSDNIPYIIYSDSYGAIFLKDTNKHGVIDTKILAQANSMLQNDSGLNLLLNANINHAIPSFFIKKLQANNWVDLDTISGVFEKLEIDGEDNLYVIWYDHKVEDDDLNKDDGGLSIRNKETTPIEIFNLPIENNGLALMDEEISDLNLKVDGLAQVQSPKIKVNKYGNDRSGSFDLDAQGNFLDIKFDSENIPYIMWYESRQKRSQIRKLDGDFGSSIGGLDTSTKSMYFDSDNNIYATTMHNSRRFYEKGLPRGNSVSKFENSQWTQIGGEFKGEIFLDIDSNDNIYLYEHTSSGSFGDDNFIMQDNIYVLNEDTWTKTKETVSDRYTWFWIDLDDTPYHMYKHKSSEEKLIDKFVDGQRENVSIFSGKGEFQGVRYGVNRFMFDLDTKTLFSQYIDTVDNKIILEKFDDTQWVEIGSFDIEGNNKSIDSVIFHNELAYIAYNNSIYKNDQGEVSMIGSFSGDSLSLKSHNGQLYIFVYDNQQLTKTLYSYDGTEITNINIGQISINSSFYFSGDIVYILDITDLGNDLYMHDGVELTHITTMQGNINIILGEKLYLLKQISNTIEDQDYYIYEYDNSALTQIGSFENVGIGVQGFFYNDGSLYFYFPNARSQKEKIYKYDGLNWVEIRENIIANPVGFNLDNNDSIYVLFEEGLEEEESGIGDADMALEGVRSQRSFYFVNKFENGRRTQLGDIFTGNIKHLRFDSQNKPYIVEEDIVDQGLRMSAEQRPLPGLSSKVHSFNGSSWQTLGDPIEYNVSDLYFDHNDTPYITNGCIIPLALAVANQKSQSPLMGLNGVSIINTNPLSTISPGFNIQKFVDGSWTMLGSDFPGWLNKIVFDPNNNPYIVRQEQFNQSKEVRKFVDNNGSSVGNLFNGDLVYFTIDGQDNPYIVINKPLGALSRIRSADFAQQNLMDQNNKGELTKLGEIINKNHSFNRRLGQVGTFTMRKKEGGIWSMVGESLNGLVGEMLFDNENNPYLVYYDVEGLSSDSRLLQAGEKSVLQNQEGEEAILNANIFVKKLENGKWVNMGQYFDGIVEGLKFDNTNNPYVIQNNIVDDSSGLLEDDGGVSLMLNNRQGNSVIKRFNNNNWDVVRELENGKIRQLEFDSENKMYALIEENNTDTLSPLENQTSTESNASKIEKYNNGTRSVIGEFLDKDVKEILVDKMDNLYVVLSNNVVGTVNEMSFMGNNTGDNLGGQIKRFDPETGYRENLGEEIDSNIQKLKFDKNNKVYLLDTNQVIDPAQMLQSDGDLSLMADVRDPLFYVRTYDTNTNEWKILGDYFSGKVSDIVFNNNNDVYVIKNPSVFSVLENNDGNLSFMGDFGNEETQSSVQKYDDEKDQWDILKGGLDGDIQFLKFDSNDVPYIMWYDFDSMKLKASNFTADGVNNTYQWYRDDIAIPGATSESYVITDQDLGKTLTFEVTSIGLDGSTSIRSEGFFVPLSVDSSNSSIGGGGGGGGSLQRDVCTGDRGCSDSYYDSLCGPCDLEEYEEQKEHGDADIQFLIENKNLFNQAVEEVKRSTKRSYSNELVQAYTFAKDLGVTTIDHIDNANLEGNLIRSHMAKMISNFAIKTLQTPINTGAKCEFVDMNDQTQEMKSYVKIACQLGLMGLESDGLTSMKNFKPNDIVTRAQFGTVLSRLLRDTKYAGGEPYYNNHLKALKVNDIMKKIENPSMKELRGRVMLMLMRVAGQ